MLKNSSAKEKQNDNIYLFAFNLQMQISARTPLQNLQNGTFERNRITSIVSIQIHIVLNLNMEVY